MREKNSNLNLSVLRIMAMMMVFSIHTGMAAHWTRFTYSGKYGVQLFFILSGYLICLSLERTDSIREFYRKRLKRILPEYYTALFIYWFIDLWRYAREGGIACAVVGWDAPMGIRYFLRYFTFLHAILPSENLSLWNNRNAWWTMSSFMVFYLLSPLFYKYLKGFFRSFTALILLLAGTPVARAGLLRLLQTFPFPAQAQLEDYCGYMPLMQLYCFFLGIVIYWAVREGKEMIYVVFLVLSFMAFNGEGYPFEIILTLFVLVALRAKEMQLPAWGREIVDFMARGSFSVYLVHGGLIGTIGGWLGMSGAIGFCLIFLSTLTVCYLYYALYERACCYIAKAAGKCK